ncbi:hypothetical protein Hanom_Chr08g00701191 [Helianthus anomalus]
MRTHPRPAFSLSFLNRRSGGYDRPVMDGSPATQPHHDHPLNLSHPHLPAKKSPATTWWRRWRYFFPTNLRQNPGKFSSPSSSSTQIRLDLPHHGFFRHR